MNRLLTWPQVHIFRQPVNDQIWVRKKPDSSPGSSGGAAAPFDTLDVEARTRWPKIQSILLSPSSAQHPYQRVGSVERRRLPLVAAVQWRIVSLSNQRPVLDLPFSPSLQTLSRLYDASYATNAEENALRSEWIGETYAVRLVSPPSALLYRERVGKDEGGGESWLRHNSELTSTTSVRRRAGGQEINWGEGEHSWRRPDINLCYLLCKSWGVLRVIWLTEIYHYCSQDSIEELIR